ncbi:MAG: SDR family NAD(P)-dependent oxidoreductase [Clostridiales bacterium]|nr:SDR family NAD(P)-dependent oxidoreductase [Clostridiales bacterium]
MNIAIVTGASSGMGRESVIQLAERFGGSLAEIWVVARRKERLQELRRRVSLPLRIFALDLTQRESLTVLERELEIRKPQVRFLVCAAGTGKMGAIGASLLETETGMVRLNCEALCGVTHVTLPWMRPYSRVILYASAAAFLPQPGFGIYAATKAFVLSYGRALRAELRGRGIAVTVVCPGAVKTEFFSTGQMKALPFYKKLVMADCRKVVRLALQDSRRGRELSVYGPFLNAFRVFVKLIPHGAILRVLPVQTERIKENED